MTCPRILPPTGNHARCNPTTYRPLRALTRTRWIGETIPDDGDSSYLIRRMRIDAIATRLMNFEQDRTLKLLLLVMKEKGSVQFIYKPLIC